MPNHVTSRVAVTGPAEEVAAFRALMIRPGDDPGGDGALAFDFGAIVPMPPVLRDSEASSDVAMGAYALGLDLRGGLYARPDYLTYPWVQALGLATREAFLAWVRAERPQALEKAEAARRCQEETGFADWYGWSIHHWGTKWNAYGFELLREEPGRLEFRFDTAWSFPGPVFDALADRFPRLRFDCAVLDEAWNFALRGVLGALAPDDAELRDVEPDDDLAALVFAGPGGAGAGAEGGVGT